LILTLLGIAVMIDLLWGQSLVLSCWTLLYILDSMFTLQSILS